MSTVCHLVFQEVLAIIQIRIIKKLIEFYVNNCILHELSVKLKLNLYYSVQNQHISDIHISVVQNVGIMRVFYLSQKEVLDLGKRGRVFGTYGSLATKQQDSFIPSLFLLLLLSLVRTQYHYGRNFQILPKNQ